MTSLREQAQRIADASATRCWIVTPRGGRAYIAYTPAQISLSYEQLITILPAMGYRSPGLDSDFFLSRP